MVIDKSPILTNLCITDAPGIMESRNPTAKRALKTIASHCTYGDIQANTKGREATNGDTAGYKRTHVSRVGATEPSIHTCAVTIRG